LSEASSAIGEFVIGISPIGGYPTGPTGVLSVIPAYAYQQYTDDPNIVAFFAAYNKLAQAYLDWFNNINLPIYTSPTISGMLLDWVAQGLYGKQRPALQSGNLSNIGPLNTWTPNSIPLNTIRVVGSVSQFATTDDVFRRIITWFFFKGDGQNFTIPWLKRRVVRFLTGLSGISTNIDNTYQVSVTFDENYAVTITVTLTGSDSITLANAQILQAAVASGVLALPFQFTFTIVIVNNIGPLGLANNGGVLQVTVATGWPTSVAGLAEGSLWVNGGVASVIPGVTPNPFASPLYFGIVTSAMLLVIGGGNLPLTPPTSGSGQLWNNGGVVSVS
jgi:hypothetical protein